MVTDKVCAQVASNNRSPAPAVTFFSPTLCRGLGRTASMRHVKWETWKPALLKLFRCWENVKACLLSWTQGMLLSSAVTWNCFLLKVSLELWVGCKNYFGVFSYSWGKCLYFAPSAVCLAVTSLLKDVECQYYLLLFIILRASSPKYKRILFLPCSCHADSFGIVCLWNLCHHPNTAEVNRISRF